VFYRFLNHFEASYTRRILNESVELLDQLWFYLVLGILISTVIKLFVSKRQMAIFFEKRRHSTTILVASAIGVVSPVGSYIIIPMSAALFRIGVPVSVLMALIVSTPLINPNLFVLTAGAFGMEMALLRLISAILLGCLAGYTSIWLIKGNLLHPASILRNNDRENPQEITGPSVKITIRSFFTELYKMTRYVSKYFFLAVILAAAIKITVNPVTIARLFDSSGFLSVLLSTAAGVPFYVCGGAAIPVVQQLAELGMPQGAALAYFISGPVTKISNLVVLQATFKGVMLIQYLVIGLAGAVTFGMVYNLFN
jgi:uncharacterized membrane protein YraQ (UPF0718 family)